MELCKYSWSGWLSPLCLACARCDFATRGQGQHLGEAVSSRQQEPLGTRLRVSGSQGQTREDASRGEIHLNESPQSQNTERLPHQPSVTDRSAFRPVASGGLCGNQGPGRGLGSGGAGGGPEQDVHVTPQASLVPSGCGLAPQGSIQGSQASQGCPPRPSVPHTPAPSAKSSCPAVRALPGPAHPAVGRSYFIQVPGWLALLSDPGPCPWAPAGPRLPLLAARCAPP